MPVSAISVTSRADSSVSSPPASPRLWIQVMVLVCPKSLTLFILAMTSQINIQWAAEMAHPDPSITAQDALKQANGLITALNSPYRIKIFRIYRRITHTTKRTGRIFLSSSIHFVPQQLLQMPQHAIKKKKTVIKICLRYPLCRSMKLKQILKHLKK